MKRYLILFLVSTTGLLFSCEKDAAVWDIPLESNRPYIKETIDDFTFNFYLINEDREKTNLILEGENFSIHFSIVNNSSTEYYYVPEFAKDRNGSFFHIFKADGEDLGKSFTQGFTNTIGLGGYSFDPKAEVVYEYPWKFQSDTTWDSYWTTYSSIETVALEKGEYFTGFNSDFVFYKGGDSDPKMNFNLSFNINFKII